MKIYLDTGGFMALFSDEGWKILRDNLGDKLNEINFCISPFTLEEFFYNILYRNEKEVVKRICGTAKEGPKERVKAFFKNHSERFAGFLTNFEPVGIEKDIIFLFSNKNILGSLTKNVKTYDILHFLTALSNRLDGFLTADKKLIEWIAKNKKLFEREDIHNFRFFIMDIEKCSLEDKNFKEI